MKRVTAASTRRSARVQMKIPKIVGMQEKNELNETGIDATNDFQPKSASSYNCESLTSPYFNNKRLPNDFYQKESVELSKDLLGKVLARRLPRGEILRGTIVETEAYPGTNIDPASHSYRGKITERTKAMFMVPGTSYVYIIHGIYHCFNISAKGEGAVCLIRGVEPLEDYECMHTFRQPKKKQATNLSDVSPDSQNITKEKGLLANTTKSTTDSCQINKDTKKRLKLYELAKGPGKLCMAFDIRRDTCDTLNMTTSEELWLEYSDDPFYNQKDSFEIASSTRIGLESSPLEAREKLWRFFIKNNFSVSTARPSLIRKALKM